MPTIVILAVDALLDVGDSRGDRLRSRGLGFSRRGRRWRGRRCAAQVERWKLAIDAACSSQSHTLVAEKHVVYPGRVAAALLGGERHGAGSTLRRPVARAIEQWSEVARATCIACRDSCIAQICAVRGRPAKHRGPGEAPRVGAGDALQGRQAAHAVIAASSGAGTSCAWRVILAPRSSRIALSSISASAAACSSALS